MNAYTSTNTGLNMFKTTDRTIWRERKEAKKKKKKFVGIHYAVFKF